MRAYWKGDGGLIGEFARRLTGSSDLYGRSGRRPHASINFVTAHDGFTLHDLVSYNDKHNEANGEDNRDGNNNNLSWNCGVEGPTDDPEINRAARSARSATCSRRCCCRRACRCCSPATRSAARSTATTTPTARTTRSSWLDWNLDDERARAARVRAPHDAPAARRIRSSGARNFFQGRRARTGARRKDIVWLKPDGTEMTAEEWDDDFARCLGVYLAGDALAETDARGEPRRATTTSWCSSTRITTRSRFRLPDDARGRVARRCVDTAPRRRPAAGRNVSAAGGVYPLQGRSLALLHAAVATATHEARARDALRRRAVDDGAARFRLWAPGAQRRAWLLDGCGRRRRHAPMRGARRTAGSRRTSPSARRGHALRVPHRRRHRRARSGLALQSRRTCTRRARVVDPLAFDWQRRRAGAGGRGKRRCIYELHVGTFTPEGTFAAAIERLDYLAELGVTAIELMPVADFPGERNWGYDGVLPFAPDASYGTPDDLKRLVDAAHARGLMVLLDVVYNHFGPEGNYLHAYAPQFFNPAHQTPWGAAINFDGAAQPHRARLLHPQRALLARGVPLRRPAPGRGARDRRRLDAGYRDRARRRACARARARAARAPRARERPQRGALPRRATRERRPLHATAQWNDDLHHALHVLVTGETRRLLRRLRRAPAVAASAAASPKASPTRASRRRIAAARRAASRSAQLPPVAFVSFLQTHDQVGNRAFGERIGAGANRARCAPPSRACCSRRRRRCCSWARSSRATTPFLFFCDFGPELARRRARGRRARVRALRALRATPARKRRFPTRTRGRPSQSSKLDWSEAGAHRPRAVARVVPRLPCAARAQHMRRACPATPSGGSFDDRAREALLRVRWTLGDGAHAAPAREFRRPLPHRTSKPLPGNADLRKRRRRLPPAACCAGLRGRLQRRGAARERRARAARRRARHRARVPTTSGASGTACPTRRCARCSRRWASTPRTDVEGGHRASRNEAARDGAAHRAASWSCARTARPWTLRVQPAAALADCAPLALARDPRRTAPAPRRRRRKFAVVRSRSARLTATRPASTSRFALCRGAAAGLPPAAPASTAATVVGAHAAARSRPRPAICRTRAQERPALGRRRAALRVRSARNWGIGDFTDLGDAGRAVGRARRGRRRRQSAARAVPARSRRTRAPTARRAGCFSTCSTSTSRRSPTFASARRRERWSASRRIPGDARRAARRAAGRLRRRRRGQAPVLELLYAHFREQHLAAGRRARATRFARLSRARRRGAAPPRAVRGAAGAFPPRRSPRSGAGPLAREPIAIPRAPPSRASPPSTPSASSSTSTCNGRPTCSSPRRGARAARGPRRSASIRDLAVSVDRGGAEAWAQQGIYALGASVGAPPDEFNLRGQDWGLPPLDSRAACATPATRRSSRRCAPTCATPARCASTT